MPKEQMSKREAEAIVRQINLLIDHINENNYGTGHMGVLLGTMIAMVNQAGYRITGEKGKGIYFWEEGDKNEYFI